MPVKRTRSAASKQPDGNSSNVTDYLGPPATKRQRRNVHSENIASKVTRSAHAASVSANESQHMTASAQHRTRQQDVEEDDDDDVVHVPFKKLISVVNGVRFGPSRTRGGMQSKVRQNGLKTVAEDEDVSDGGNGEDENEGADETPPSRSRGQPVKAKHTAQQEASEDQHVGPKTRSRAKAFGRVDNENASRSESRPQRKEQAAGRTRSGISSSVQTRQQQSRERQPAAAGKDARPDDEDATPDDEKAEEDIQGVATQATEDSAFIDAPWPHEKLPAVKCVFNSLGGMIKTLNHPAWTGVKYWDANPDMACSTKPGGKLIECFRLINDLLLESYDARYEGNADGDPEVTINYLRSSSEQLKSLFADTTKLVDQICTQELAIIDNIGTHAVQRRKLLLGDITKRLMPMLVLVLQKAYDVGPSEERRGVTHLTLNSFTIQFPLRAIGWSTRLMEAFSRGLKEWPIDDESGQSDEELDIAEVAKKQAKTKNRKLFQKNLASLYSSVKQAANALEMQARETVRKARQGQDRQRATLEQEQYKRQVMIRQRELWAKAERERQEDARKDQIQMERFARASQALRSIPNPLAELWKETYPNNGHGRSQTTASSVPIPLHERSSVTGRAGAIPQVESDIDFFLNMDKADQMLDRPVQLGLLTNDHRTENGRPRTINGLQSTRTLEAWGAPRWSRAEEKMLLLRIKFDKTYNPATLAPKLRRSAEDIARKAAELKAIYRAIYERRGTGVPVWAW